MDGNLLRRESNAPHLQRMRAHWQAHDLEAPGGIGPRGHPRTPHLDDGIDHRAAGIVDYGATEATGPPQERVHPRLPLADFTGQRDERRALRDSEVASHDRARGE